MITVRLGLQEYDTADMEGTEKNEPTHPVRSETHKRKWQEVREVYRREDETS